MRRHYPSTQHPAETREHMLICWPLANYTTALRSWNCQIMMEASARG